MGARREVRGETRRTRKKVKKRRRRWKARPLLSVGRSGEAEEDDEEGKGNEESVEGGKEEDYDEDEEEEEGGRGGGRGERRAPRARRVHGRNYRGLSFCLRGSTDPRGVAKRPLLGW